MKSLDFSVLFRKLIEPPLLFVARLGLVVLLVFLALVAYAWMKYRFPIRVNDFTIKRLMGLPIRMKLLSFLRWLRVDFYYSPEHVTEFMEHGLTIFVGRQGAGKTVSMVHYLNKMHRRYPEALIITNFSYAHGDHQMDGWRDFFEYRNGTKGVIFAIDEIHSEFSSAAWKDFPESLLSEISQQRKQRIKIVATAQRYNRVVKQIREQTRTVVRCKTVAGRWTFNLEFDANDFEILSENPTAKKHIKSLGHTSFVQSDNLRLCFDTYEKIKRLQKMDFIPRNERGNE
jgi:ATP-dependent Clp protease ATP-binding subunit ClpX